MNWTVGVIKLQLVLLTKTYTKARCKKQIKLGL